MLDSLAGVIMHMDTKGGWLLQELKFFNKLSGYNDKLQSHNKLSFIFNVLLLNSYS